MNYIVEFPGTATLYVFIVVINVFLARTAEVTKMHSLSKFLLLLIITIFSLVSGLRGYDVGTDTPNYVTHIYNYQLDSNYSRFSTEPGLKFISLIAGYFIKNPTIVLIIVAVIINTLIISRLWSYKSNISFSYAVFFYSVSYYFMTFSGIRQMVAVSIVFFASKFILEKQMLKFMISVGIASLFHNSALIALGIPILDVILDKKKYRKGRLLLSVTVIPLVLLFLIYYIEMQFGIFSRYSEYADNLHFQSGSGITLWIRILIGVSIFVIVKRNDFVSEDQYNFFKRNYRVYILGLFLIIPGYYIANINRIAFYYTIYEVIIFSSIAKNHKKLLIKALFIFIVLFSLVMFLSELINPGLGHMPYTPYWVNYLNFSL